MTNFERERPKAIGSLRAAFKNSPDIEKLRNLQEKLQEEKRRQEETSKFNEEINTLLQRLNVLQKKSKTQKITEEFTKDSLAKEIEEKFIENLFEELSEKGINLEKEAEERTEKIKSLKAEIRRNFNSYKKFDPNDLEKEVKEKKVYHIPLIWGKEKVVLNEKGDWFELRPTALSYMRQEKLGQEEIVVIFNLPKGFKIDPEINYPITISKEIENESRGTKYFIGAIKEDLLRKEELALAA